LLAGTSPALPVRPRLAGRLPCRRPRFAGSGRFLPVPLRPVIWLKVAGCAVRPEEDEGEVNAHAVMCNHHRTLCKPELLSCADTSPFGNGTVIVR